MAFQIKDFASITASCINWMKAATQRVTDFNIGSVVRTMLEAVAAEIEELYQQFFVGVKEAIPVAVYNSFNFAALPAQPAMGMVRVTITAQPAAVVVQAGTVFSAAGVAVNYVVTQDTTIAAGSTYVDVPVSASATGSLGNISAGVSMLMAPQVAGFASAASLAAFVSGQDAESDDDRQSRFASYIVALARGTVAALEYGAKTVALFDASGNETERVKYAHAVEPWLTDNTQPIGLVNVYVHNGIGATSGALVAQVSNVMYGYYDTGGNAVPGYKAAGTNCVVYAATDQALNVAAALTAAPGYVKANLLPSVTAALQAYINGLGIGAPAIFAELVALAMNVDGVANFIPTAPLVDVTPAANAKLTPGSITLT